FDKLDGNKLKISKVVYSKSQNNDCAWINVNYLENNLRLIPVFVLHDIKGSFIAYESGNRKTIYLRILLDYKNPIHKSFIDKFAVHDNSIEKQLVKLISTDVKKEMFDSNIDDSEFQKYIGKVDLKPN